MKAQENRGIAAASIMALVVCLATSGPVFAGFQVMDEAMSSQLEEKVMKPVGLYFVSEPPAVIQAIRGFGKNMPIKEALKMIVPAKEGWSAFMDQSIPVLKPVSWKGGKAWTEVLRDIAEKNNLHMDLNWDLKRVDVDIPTPEKEEVADATTGVKTVQPSVSEAKTIGEKPPESAKASVTAAAGELAKAEAKPADGAAAEGEAAAKREGADTQDMATKLADVLVTPLAQFDAKPEQSVGEAETAKPTFSIAAGERLRGAVARWARNSGYTMVWDADGVDFEIDSTVSFGSIETGLSKVAKAFDLNITIWRANKTVVVKPTR